MSDIPKWPWHGCLKEIEKRGTLISQTYQIHLLSKHIIRPKQINILVLRPKMGILFLYLLQDFQKAFNFFKAAAFDIHYNAAGPENQFIYFFGLSIFKKKKSGHLMFIEPLTEFQS